jgi:hypothetical protein
MSDCLVGPYIMKLMGQLEVKLLHVVWDENFAKDPRRTYLAFAKEIREEMIFFGHIVHCSDSNLGLLRQARTIIPTAK